MDIEVLTSLLTESHTIPENTIQVGSQRSRLLGAL